MRANQPPRHPDRTVKARGCTRLFHRRPAGRAFALGAYVVTVPPHHASRPSPLPLPCLLLPCAELVPGSLCWAGAGLPELSCWRVPCPPLCPFVKPPPTPTKTKPVRENVYAVHDLPCTQPRARSNPARHSVAHGHRLQPHDSAWMAPTELSLFVVICHELLFVESPSVHITEYEIDYSGACCRRGRVWVCAGRPWT